MTNRLDERLLDLAQQINWDNWEDEEATTDGRKRYMKVTDVLYSRLEWMADMARENKEENEEHLETIKMVQELLAAVESPKN
jgi:hypothetical protein